VKYLVLILAFMITTGTVTQAGHAPKIDVSQLSDLVEKAGKEKMPEWKYLRGEPVYKGENVLIASFSSSDKRVVVAIVPYRSQAEAESRLRDYVARDKAYQKLDDFDEGYSCGFAHSQVVFKKGRLVVFVSIMLDEMNKEVVEINKQFAKLVAAALSKTDWRACSLKSIKARSQERALSFYRGVVASTTPLWVRSAGALQITSPGWCCPGLGAGNSNRSSGPPALPLQP
jgi:hypothetical protein